MTMVIDFARRLIGRPPAPALPEEQEELQELEALRKGHSSYSEWMKGQYAAEMLRRFLYYKGTQVTVNPAMLENRGYVSAAQWGAAHSGPGWDDIRSMLPAATQRTVVKPFLTNFTQVVTDNRQIVYSVPAKGRSVIKGDQVMEKESDLLERIYEAAEHDTVSDQLCKWTGLFFTAFQQIAYDEEDERIVKKNIQPQDVYVIPDPERITDIQSPECFLAVRQGLDYETKQTPVTNQVWQCWWRDKWWYETEDSGPHTDLTLTEQGVNENPYKDVKGRPLKPFIVVHDGPTDLIHDAGSDLLIQQNQCFDRGFTALTHAQEFQGFSVPVYSGTTLEEVESQPYSPAAPVVLEDPQAELKFAYPAAQISENQGAVIKGMRTSARLQMIDPELVDPETKIQSGTARAQGRTAQAERRIVEYPKWAPYERESYRITATIWNYHVDSEKLVEIPRYNSPSISKAEAIKIVVEFSNLEVITDGLANAATNKMNLDMNVVSRAEIVAATRKIPLAMAEKLVDEIKERNEKDKPPSVLDKVRQAGESGIPRIGQPGNRPTNPDRDASRTGGTVTAQSGNQSMDLDG